MTEIPRADVLVQPLTPDDLVAVAQCIAIDASAFPYASSPFGTRDSAARAWVARDRGDGRVLGFLAGRVRQGALHVEGLAVDAAARRRGVGRALVRACARFARASAERSFRTVVLHVSVANRAAVALYDSEGFVIRRRLPDFYPGGAFDGQRDAYEMVLYVS
jgi:ribosomal protein S18 acetylase RimI-like enzyme